MQAAVPSTSSIAGSAVRSATGLEPTAQFITFTVGSEEYGIDIMVVREIKGWTETTPIPKAPQHMRGVINLRGIIVPIFDLRARFGMGLTEPSRMHVVIIVDAGGRTVGLLVDTVSDIIAVDPASVRPVPDLDLADGDSLLQGLVPLDDRMVTLVSLDGLFGGQVHPAGPELAGAQALSAMPPPATH